EHAFGPIQNQELISHQNGLSNNATETTGFTEPDDGDDRIQKESENVAHARMVSKPNKLKNSGCSRNSPTTRVAGPFFSGGRQIGDHRAGCPNPVRPPGERVLGRGARWPDQGSRTLHRAGLLPHTERRGRMPSSAKCRSPVAGS